MKPLNTGEPTGVGRYRVFAALGEGGMGRVLLGVSADGRLVAIKQVHPGFAHDPGFRERFRREVASSRLVSGAYTAPVMDADPNAPTPWLASMFVPGPSLAEAVAAGGPLPPMAIRSLAAGLALALGDIHRAGLIHRDLKPSNVILTGDGPRVIDFGIARAAEGDSELTHTGAVIGSPGFMSPEQAEGKPLTPASDMFAFGALLVMAASGNSPFTGTSTPHTLYNVVHVQPDLRRLAPEVRQLAEPCLAKNPADRPSPAWVLERLGPIPPTTSPWPPVVPHLIETQQAEIRRLLNPPPSKRSRRGLYAGIAAAAVVLLAGGVVAAVSLNKDGPPPAVAAPSGSPQPDEPVTTPVNPDPLGPDNLRKVDLCKVLEGREVPGLGKLSTKNGTQFDWCTYSSPAGKWLELKIGGDLFQAEAGGELEGLPLAVKGSAGSCEVAVPVTGLLNTNLTAGVNSLSTKDEACPVVKAALADAVKRIRAGGHEHDLAAGTLAPLDPCALVGAATVDRLIGPVVETIREHLHECRYDAAGSVRLSFVRGTPPTEATYSSYAATATLDLGGTKVYLARSDDGAARSTCSLTWQHRPVSDRVGENVELTVGTSGAEKNAELACEKAKNFAGALLQKLPKP
ncbi:serine/threonine-protein kinase [Amycolatopsis regifaucium]|uniref:Protein kinase n=1 Tax=Amycolatopsis regifaucium TaxID=546365 RepID=A0A154M552_9PSEU|nr:serine/threonine-protein kinase [Amycolatopsis regifaucium]KZB79738.1 protein kinase [Amycolatopsis regifaucium]OKA09945.1 serine/threonine protein kinase [Amycolatopsis regifaucium]SFI68072.1 Serine/threonine protein kinase [Amycolatopsis regifaucium]